MRAAKLLCALGLLLAALLFFPSPALAQREDPPTPVPVPLGDDAFMMPYRNYATTQGPHGQSYGHDAIDIAAGEGATIVSPINGYVTGVYVDGLGNNTIIIENDQYKVTMLHGIYTAHQGEYVRIGTPVGTESNIGNTWCSDGRPAGGRDCGYHTHLNVFDKDLRVNVDPNDIETTPSVVRTSIVPIASQMRTAGSALLVLIGVLGVILVARPGGMRAVGRGLVKTIHFVGEAAYWIGFTARGAQTVVTYKHEKKRRRKLLFRNILLGVTLSTCLSVVAFLTELKDGQGEVLALEGQPSNYTFSTMSPSFEQSYYTVETAKISHYWPPYGGPNCFRFVNGECKSRMSSGVRWQDGIDTALACPAEFPFGTQFLILGKLWTCLDRGGKIVRTTDNKIWLDLLTQDAPVPFGTEVQVLVILPEK